MSFNEKTRTSGTHRCLRWVAGGIKWIILAVLFSVMCFFFAVGQIPLGPQFKLAIVGAPIGGIAITVTLALGIRLLSKLSLKRELKEKSGKLQWPEFSRREILAGAFIIGIVIVACWFVLETWTSARDGRIASRAEMAREEFEVFFYGNGFEQTQVNQTLAELQEAYEHLGEELPKQIREDQISVRLFRDLREYRNITATPWAFGSVLCNANGTFIAIPLEYIPDLLSEDESRTPMHEMVHALMCQALGPEAAHSVPVWFHEGMAQLYESDGPGKGYGVSSRILVWFKRRDLMAAHPFCSASTWVSKTEAQLFYRTSLEFVRTLEYRHGRDKLIAVVQAVQDGGTFEESLQSQLGGTCDELYERWFASW